MKEIILAIDTSTGHAGIAAGHDGQVLIHSWPAGRTQTTSVLPAIDLLLQEAGLAPADLSAVAVATGPGTFTGLRVGMSIAKGIVLARGIPLIGLPTLEIAVADMDASGDVVAVLPAGRGRVVWERFRPGEPSAARNTTLDELVGSLASMPDAVVVGEMDDAQQEKLASVHSHVRWEYRDPAAMIRIAEERLRRGEVDDPVTLEPVYLHGVTVSAGPVEDRLKRRS